MRRMLAVLIAQTLIGSSSLSATTKRIAADPGSAASPRAVPVVTKDPVPTGQRAIYGTVIDAEGRVVRDAQVALVPVGLFDPAGANYSRVHSAADGSFRFATAPEGRYAVTATSTGGTAVAVTDIDTGPAGLRLQLGSNGRQLSGRVFDRNGYARGDAEIRLSRGLGENGQVFVTDSAPDGRWSLLVPDGDYHVNAVLPGYAAAQQSLPRGRDSADLVLAPIWGEAPVPPEVVDWLRTNQMPIATVEPGHGLADLAPLRAVVGDARVVGLGEATHGTREIFQLKHRLFEFLVSEMGFTVFAIEFSLPEAFAIDDYVMGGEGDPELLIAGQFVAVWQAEELLQLVRWMRAWNDTHARKVRFQGLDIRLGIRAAKETFAYLEQVDAAALLSPAAQALAPLADPFMYRDVLTRTSSDLAELANHARDLAVHIEARRDEYSGRSDQSAWWRSAMQARTLVNLLEWRAASDMAARVEVRERAMAQNLLRALDHFGADARAVLWAHNAHVFGNSDAQPRMAGVHLRQRLGTSYRAFGSVLHHGAYQAVDPLTGRLRNFTIPRPPAGSFEDILASTMAPAAAIDLRALPKVGPVADWFGAFQTLRQFDGLYDDKRPENWASPTTIVTRDYDALLFLAEGTRANALPFARAMYVEAPPSPLPLSNAGFEEIDTGFPRGWLWQRARERVCGYALALDRERAIAGAVSARIERNHGPRFGECAAQLRQLIDATPYRGQRVRLRGSIQVERPGEHAHFYLQSGTVRASRSASGSACRIYDVELTIPDNSTSLEVGLAFHGEGRTWLDAVSLTVVPHFVEARGDAGQEPLRPAASCQYSE